MKLAPTIAAALLFAGGAVAQTAPPGDPAAPATPAAPGDAMAPASSSPSSASPSTSSASASPSTATASADAMTVLDGRWMMGSRKATKAEIAQWKQDNPGKSQPPNKLRVAPEGVG